MTNADQDPIREEDDDETVRRKILFGLDGEARVKMERTLQNPRYLAAARRAAREGALSVDAASSALLPKELIAAADDVLARDTLSRKKMELSLRHARVVDAFAKAAVEGEAEREPVPDDKPGWMNTGAYEQVRNEARVEASAAARIKQAHATERMPVVVRTSPRGDVSTAAMAVMQTQPQPVAIDPAEAERVAEPTRSRWGLLLAAVGVIAVLLVVIRVLTTSGASQVNDASSAASVAVTAAPAVTAAATRAIASPVPVAQSAQPVVAESPDVAPPAASQTTDRPAPHDVTPPKPPTSPKPTGARVVAPPVTVDKPTPMFKRPE